ncbi:MAG: hypothetical protein WA874_03990, partial [Chryseosolibacter sp.]
ISASGDNWALTGALNNNTQLRTNIERLNSLNSIIIFISYTNTTILPRYTRTIFPVDHPVG